MQKIEPRVKSVITTQDKINATEYIVSAYFTEDEDGNVRYTPYYGYIGQVNAIIQYFVDGVEFDEGEDVFEIATNDWELKPIIDSFYTYNQETKINPTKEQVLFGGVMTNVMDIVEYKKKENIANIQNAANGALTYKMFELIEKENEKLQNEIETIAKLDQWLNNQAEINAMIPPETQKRFVENMDINTVMDAIMNKYDGSQTHMKNKELVEATRKIREQENKIIELQNDYAREVQKEKVKNVVVDKE